ncbi:hypothetical protein ACWDZ4_09955 [Streptomyces sp. NPDC003016]
MRFLASSLRVRGPWLSWAPTVTLGMGMAFSLLTLHTAASSGAETRALTAVGRGIPEHFGVSAEYACVEPTSREAPYYGTPPPHDSPVVVFGQSGDRVEFRDPAASQKAGIRLEDARIRVTPGSDSSCAKAAR